MSKQWTAMREMNPVAILRKNIGRAKDSKQQPAVLKPSKLLTKLSVQDQYSAC